MDRDVTVRFYEIEGVGNGLSFADTLNKVRSLAALDERHSEVGDGVVLRLENATRQNGIITGDFTRVQTDNLPSHPTGAASDPLPIDRLGHHAAFCYDTHTSIIAIQFDIKMAIGRVCKYAASFAEGTKFVAMPVLRQDALARFENETPTKFTVRVAKVHHFTDSVTGATDFEEAIDGMGALFEAPNVQITVSARGSGGGLDRDSVLTTIRRYLGFSQEFEGIKSVTAETAESPDAFNFLKCLLKQSEMLDLPRNDPSAGRAV